MQTSDAQVRKLMEEITKHGQVGRASLKANMDRKTGRKYVAAGKLPSEMKKPRTGKRTRVDPFADDWPAIEAKLKETPEFEAKTLFEELVEQQPDRYVEARAWARCREQGPRGACGRHRCLRDEVEATARRDLRLRGDR